MTSDVRIPPIGRRRQAAFTARDSLRSGRSRQVKLRELRHVARDLTPRSAAVGVEPAGQTSDEPV